VRSIGKRTQPTRPPNWNREIHANIPNSGFRLPYQSTNIFPGIQSPSSGYLIRPDSDICGHASNHRKSRMVSAYKSGRRTLSIRQRFHIAVPTNMPTTPSLNYHWRVRGDAEEGHPANPIHTRKNWPYSINRSGLMVVPELTARLGCLPSQTDY
jgi:hypothetical protein